jgi:Na+/proline symporter
LPAEHFAVFAEDFGQYPALKAGGYFLATLLLLMGIQSMYQKFYSAKSPTEARRAVALWIVGTVVVETLVVVIAIYAASSHWAEIRAFDVAARVKAEVASGQLAPSDAAPRALALVGEEGRKLRPDDLPKAEALLRDGFASATNAKDVARARVGIDPGAVVLQAAEDITKRGPIGLLVGLLLLGAACAVVISTGMNYLLSPTTNIMRDIYQRFLRPDADPKRMVALQKVFVVLLGLCAFLMIFVPTVLGSSISVLRYSYFAYTMYGVAITPALIAALAWKRATRQGGLASIISGTFMALLLELVIPNLFPSVLQGGDPWGVPSIYPASLVSIGALIIVSLLTPAPTKKELAPLFGDGEAKQPPTASVPTSSSTA